MTTPRRPSVSWADLLLFRSLTGTGDDSAAAARLIGLPEVELPEQVAEELTEHRDKQPRNQQPDSPTSSSAFRLPLRCPQGFVARQNNQARPDAEPLTLLAWEPQEAVKVERMLQPSGQPRAPARTLLDLERLRARWRGALSLHRGSDLDLDRMVQTLARNEWPVPLPQRDRAYRVQDVHVCVDMHPDRQFLLNDYAALWKTLGESCAKTRRYVHAMEGAWDWERALAEIAQEHAVLLLAEPRLMPQVDRRVWWDVAATLRHRGVTVLWSLDWVPEACAETTWTGGSIRYHEIAADAQALYESAFERSKPQALALSCLLACLAVAVTVEPALVREMIRALQLPGGLALEQALWCHPDLDGALPFRQWRPAAQRRHLRRLRQESPEVLVACWRVLTTLHAHVHQVQRDHELLNWADAAEAADASLIARECGSSALHDALTRYAQVAWHLLQLSRHSNMPDSMSAASSGSVRAAADERLQSMPDSLRRYPELEEMLSQAALRPSGQTGGASSWSDAPSRYKVAVRQQGQRLILIPVDQVRGPGVTLAELEVERDWLLVEKDGNSQSLELTQIRHIPVVLAVWDKSPPREVRLHGPAGEVRLQTATRPHWAGQFAQSSVGLQGLIHWPDGTPLWIDPRTSTETVYNHIGGWWLEMDRYGPRLSNPSLNRRFKSVEPIYFRHLPAGTFLQGSPENVGEDGEHPQHPVTLTQGLWLAETPCTQALWKAVMRNNPSYFQGADGPRRPVENVSWNDVRIFLKKFQTLLPFGCEVELPTESQWEYACRAGTSTEYSWGDNPEPNKANYDIRGNRSTWHGGGTTPVAAYRPNVWGLFDMHGNVWEWCKDTCRTYTIMSERDPEGDGSGGRALRGGSWLVFPSYARAASRRDGALGLASSREGFRFALTYDDRVGEMVSEFLQASQDKLDSGSGMARPGKRASKR